MDKNNKVLIIVLLLLVVLLGGYIAYDKVLSNDSPAKETVVVKKISDVTGKYVATFDNLDNTGDVTTASVTLILYENGVFTYVFNHLVPSGTLGNYYVDGDNIILTNWFNSGSDTGLRVTKGTKTLTINADGSITDSNIGVKTLNDNNITTANFVKDGEASQFDLNNRLATAFFTEFNHTIEEPVM